MDVTSSVFWAAFGGGAAAGIFTLIAVIVAQWVRWFIDRPLVKVSMTFAQVFGHPLFDEKTQYICLEAKNPHIKTVTLSTFGFYYKSQAHGKLQVMPDGTCQFPFELEGGKAISQRTSQENLFKALREGSRKPSDLKCVYFESSSGKIFLGKIPRVSMRVLNERFRAPGATGKSK